jgi:DNA adenine methylase
MAALNKPNGLGTTSVTPPLKWAGGKRWQLPHLIPLWQNHASKRFVEPFCGGLAVSLGLRPKRALLNDINPHLVNFYRWLKKGLEVEIALRNEKAHYYESRERFNELTANGGRKSAEAATLFYYLNRTGYNGLCRFNRSGGFNVPFGRYGKLNYRDDFLEYRPVLRKWQFKSQDFASLVLEDDDFVYADPPYDVEFTQYSSGGFDWEHQVRTAEWLSEHPGPVILVNQATPRIKKLYRSLGFKLTMLDAPRRINCTGDRTPAPEVLATRNL